MDEIEIVGWDAIHKREKALLKKRDRALNLIVKHFDDLWD